LSLALQWKLKSIEHGLDLHDLPRPESMRTAPMHPGGVARYQPRTDTQRPQDAADVQDLVPVAGVIGDEDIEHDSNGAAGAYRFDAPAAPGRIRTIGVPYRRDGGEHLTNLTGSNGGSVDVKGHLVAVRREPTPIGPITEFFDRLQELYLDAGEPGVRQIATGLGRGVLSHTTVHSAFRGPRIPKWGNVELIIEYLGGPAQPAMAAGESCQQQGWPTRLWPSPR
jgi:hypothetical protein